MLLISMKHRKRFIYFFIYESEKVCDLSLEWDILVLINSKVCYLVIFFSNDKDDKRDLWITFKCGETVYESTVLYII